MNTEKTNNDDLKDRILDHALREVVGNESPPDLSEQIMRAATGDRTKQQNTLAQGADDMATHHTSNATRRSLWVAMTVAASVLIGSMLIFPEFRGVQTETYSTPGDRLAKAEVAQRDGKLNLDAYDDNSLEGQDRSALSVLPGIVFEPRNSTQEWDSSMGRQKKKDSVVELPEFDVVSVEKTVEVPARGTVLSGGIKRLTDSGSPINDKLMMDVTPQIIIQEEEERLGITDGDAGTPYIERKFRNTGRPGLTAQDSAPAIDTPESGMGLQGLVGDANAVSPQKVGQQPSGQATVGKHPVSGQPLPDFSVDLDQPLRISSFGLTTPQNGNGQATVPTTSSNESLATSGSQPETINFWRSHADEAQRRGHGQRFRIDATPGQDVNRYLMEFDVPKAKDKQELVAPVEGDDKSDPYAPDVLHQRQSELRIVKLQQQYRRLAILTARDSKILGGLEQLEAEIEQLQRLEKGRGADASGDKYARIHDNPFVKAVGEKAVSTFSIDVDTASYANVRQFIAQSGQLPPSDAVRIEELVNYFDYDYTPPTDDTPFASHVEVAGCPWKAGHRLVRVGIKGRELQTDNRPQSNLVFLIDVSGSMNEPSKLPLLVEGMKMLTRELGENDRIAIVVYASSEGLALPSTRGDQQDTILSALENLRAGGSTAGGAGIELAYEIAEKNFIKGGVNRIVLATDGDFNVGVTDEGGLTRLAEQKAKDSGVFLTVLGFGRGNLNDSMMEKISNAGNGNYHYIDNTTEARKVLVAEMAGTLVTIAKDVKIQIEFNPAQVAAYRLIGYENRMLKTEDFNDDTKDAGEIGAGHTVTAVYEVVPAGQSIDTPGVDPLKYQQPAKAKPLTDVEDSEELLTLKIRYKQPDGDTSTKLEFPITDEGQSFAKASDDFKFASAVASFGMQLRHSKHQGITSYSAVEEIAQDGMGQDKHGYRAEFLQLVRQAKQLAGE